MDQTAQGAKIRDFVGSLARGLSVLRAFNADHPEMTLTEVAALTSLTRAGARRFLLTLTELGYVNKNHRLFRLTPKVLELGYAFMASMPLSERSQPYLKQVTEQTGESSSLAVLDDEDVVYIARSPARRIMLPGIQIGTRLPASYTSLGRVLLAFKDEQEREQFLTRLTLDSRTRFSLTSKSALRKELAKVRDQGYALVDQELEEGLRSLAVPIRDPSNNVVAAINVSTNAATVSLETMVKKLLPVLKKAAAEIQSTLRT